MKHIPPSVISGLLTLLIIYPPERLIFRLINAVTLILVCRIWYIEGKLKEGKF